LVQRERERERKREKRKKERERERERERESTKQTKPKPKPKTQTQTQTNKNQPKQLKIGMQTNQMKCTLLTTSFLLIEEFAKDCEKEKFTDFIIQLVISGHLSRDVSLQVKRKKE